MSADDSGKGKKKIEIKDTADVEKTVTAEEPVVEVEDTKLVESAAETVAPEAAKPAKVKKPNIFKRYFGSLKRNRKTQIITAAVVVVLVGVFAVPTTRYALAAPFWRQHVGFFLTDAKTGRPISEAEVKIGGLSSKTNAEGYATISNVPVGKRQATITKKYYKDTTTSVLVPISKPKQPVKTQLEATGRQVEILVINRINLRPQGNALVKALDSDARTDKEGRATIVLPADNETTDATVALEGYNTLGTKIKIVEGPPVFDNTLQITPAGKIYFLSKKSGKIDVVKTNLDGSDRQTVLAGTGKEEQYNTVLLASRNWKYLTLHSKRDSDKAKLYLIETENDKLTTIDEGNASFIISGWSDHHFVYTVERDKKDWESKKFALKSYNADKKQITTIDETASEGSDYNHYKLETFGTVYTLGSNVIYSKNWNANDPLGDKKAVIVKANNDGSNKNTLKSFGTAEADSNNYIYVQSRPYEANGVYFRLGNKSDSDIYEYHDGKFEITDEIKSEEFFDSYPTYLLSPSGNENLWGEERDGKNTLFVGDKDGDNGKEVAALSEMNQYGWYTDGYLLLSKKGSELYIIAKDYRAQEEPFKITDYHKPSQSFRDYGGGYGGF